VARVAVLGIGRMGAAIASKVAASGHQVVMWNRTRARADAVALKSQGAVVADEAAEAVRGVDVVLSMLAHGPATCEVLLAEDVMNALDDDVVVVDLATSGVDAARRLAEGLSRRGIAFVDAPVSGSIPAVESGTLLVMAGGDPPCIERAAVVLDSFARLVIRVGDPGAGQVMKLAVNLVLHDLNAAIAEALGVAEGADISREAAYTVLQESVVGAPYVQYKRAAFLDPSTAVAMSLTLVEKDLLLITEQARRTGAPALVTEEVLRSVHRAVLAGMGDHDMADLSRLPASR
jgi:3-hydroxyisobutyrate dehydrogenase-like beta-hydroxyacid dehydrogenase